MQLNGFLSNKNKQKEKMVYKSLKRKGEEYYKKHNKYKKIFSGQQ